MKIKNLKYIFVLLLSSSLFYSITFGACNNEVPNTCLGTNFNNSEELHDSSLVYISMFEELQPLACSSNNDAAAAAEKVLKIQQSMQQNCGFTGCLDSKFGPETKSRLSDCAADYCRGKGQVAPNLSGENLVCNDLYILDESTHCCKSNACEILYGADHLTDGPDAQGNCADGSAKDTLYNCCINISSVCDSETGYVNLRSVTPNNTGLKCEDCGYGKKPSEDRLKCVCNAEEACCGVELYLGIPFIGDCIEMNSDSSRPNTTTVSNVSAFPVLMQGLMKILMSVILVVSFMLVIISGLMMTAGAFKSTSFDKGKTMIKNVIISLILLGLSGLILKLINPSFFGG